MGRMCLIGSVSLCPVQGTRQIWPASLTAPAGAGKMGLVHYIDASRTR